MTSFTRIAVRGDNLPTGGRYVPAFRIANGDLIVTAGVVSIDADGKTVGTGDPAAQARQILSNLQDILTASGATLDDVIHLRVFSTDMRNRAVINAERLRAFKDHIPASTHVEVRRLAREELLLEIEAMAFIPSKPSKNGF